RRLVNEWALTGEPFDAKAAQAAGLLNYVVPVTELDAKVDWLIGRIIEKSPTAIRRGKYAMRAIASMSFDESIAYTESQIGLLAMTEDAKEGLKAFAEKRKPSWPGKGCFRIQFAKFPFVIARDAKQSRMHSRRQFWIASSLRSSQ